MTPQEPCLNPACDQPREIRVCHGHPERRSRRCGACRMYRWRHSGEERPLRLTQPSTDVACANPACDRRRMLAPRSDRHCAACRIYWSRYHVERPERLTRPRPRVVSRYCAMGPWCDRPPRTRGYCNVHYRRLRQIERAAQRAAAG